MTNSEFKQKIFGSLNPDWLNTYNSVQFGTFYIPLTTSNMLNHNLNEKFK